MTSDTVRLVVVNDRGLRWAVLADDVREIVGTAGWGGEPLVDVADRWHAGLDRAVAQPAAEAPQAARALVVRTGVGDRALLSPHVSFHVTERSKLLSLPSLRAWGRGAAMVAGIIYSDFNEPLIVLNPDGFFDRNGPAPVKGPAKIALTFAQGETG